MNELKTPSQKKGQIVRVRNAAHWSVIAALLSGRAGDDQHGLIERNLTQFHTPSSLRTDLYDQGFRIISELFVTTQPHQCTDAFCEIAARFGCDQESTENLLNIYEIQFEVEPAPPVVDENTVNELGPHKLTGSSVIVLTYNSQDTIKPCVQSILPTLTDEDELILVDNASRDGTRLILKGLEKEHPRIKLIFNNENLGFSAGCNVGMKASLGKYLVLLNPDTVVTENWLKALTARLEDPEIGAVGPLGDNAGGAHCVWHYLPSDEFGTSPPEAISTALQNRYSQQDGPTKMLIGFCLMTRRETLNQVGLLDEDLFLGGEDFELSWRLRTHGYKLLVAKDAFIAHESNASFRTEPSEHKQRLLKESTAALYQKLETYYGRRPTSREIWGIDFC